MQAECIVTAARESSFSGRGSSRLLLIEQTQFVNSLTRAKGSAPGRAGDSHRGEQEGMM